MTDEAPHKNRLKTFTRAQAESMFKFLEKVIMESKTPVLPPEYANWDTFNSLYQHTTEIKNALGNFAKGDLDLRLVKKGATSGSLKAILANLSHLAWQFKLAASGDYSHSVDFMGDFSEAFNLMTSSLRRHELEIQEKQEELAKMAEELKKEIHRRDHIEAALKESEKNYRNQALTDPLTRIYNRSYFNEAGKREVEMCRRQGSDLCLLMMDLDKFKQFNDTYGHLSGDAALIHVTSIINDLKRNTDIFARYGGEEFVLLLPQTNFAGGLVIAERIKNEVAARPDPAPNCKAPLTLSIGLASLAQDDALKDPDSCEDILRKLLARADEGLYMGKNRGRNQVCWVGMGGEASPLVPRPTANQVAGAEPTPEPAALSPNPAPNATPSPAPNPALGPSNGSAPSLAPNPRGEVAPDSDGVARLLPTASIPEPLAPLVEPVEVAVTGDFSEPLNPEVARPLAGPPSLALEPPKEGERG